MGIDIRRNIYRPMQDMTFAAATHLVLPLHSDAATPTLGFGAGIDGLYQSAEGTLYVGIDGARRIGFDTSGVFSNQSSGFLGKNLTASATDPTLIPDRSDLNTGLGHGPGVDQLSLIAGAFEGLRLTESGNVVNMDIVCHNGEVVTHNGNVVTLN